MKQRIIRTVVAVLLAGAVGVGVQAMPANAAPTDVHINANQFSPQYQVGDCIYKVLYGNYGATAYAQMRIYNPSTCNPVSVVLHYADGSGVHQVVKSMSQGYSTGSDGCGSYRQLHVQSPVSAYAIKVATLPPGPWSNWRTYAIDGQAFQPVHSLC